jgi:hypothetical protein
MSATSTKLTITVSINTALTRLLSLAYAAAGAGTALLVTLSECSTASIVLSLDAELVLGCRQL